MAVERKRKKALSALTIQLEKQKKRRKSEWKVQFVVVVARSPRLMSGMSE
jgi:hypothetical protein